METLGSLCDKLTIVKLKQEHSTDKKRLESLAKQEEQLIDEIDQYVANAISGRIEISKLSFNAYKVFKDNGVRMRVIEGSFGEVFSELAKINCELWHVQEKVYDFKNVPLNQKDIVIERLAILNLDRNNCIEKLNNLLIQTCIEP